MDNAQETSYSDKQFIINDKYFVNPPTNEITDISAIHSGKKVSKIEPRIMKLLVFLASGKGEVFSRDLLIEKIWDNNFVGEEGLTQAVSRLRKVLNDKPGESQIIQTIPKKGYRLTADIKESTNEKAEVKIEEAKKEFSKKSQIILLLFIFFIVSLIVYWGGKYLSSNDHDFSPSLFLKAQPVTSEIGLEMYPAISPDESMVAFSMRREKENSFDIYIKTFLSGEMQPFVVNSSDDLRPAWSPDGKFIAYLKLCDGKSEIFIKPLAGGEEIKIIDCTIESNPTLCWADNKTIIFSDNKEEENKRIYKLFSKNIESGEIIKLTSPPNECIGDMNPVVSADKKYIFFKRVLNPGLGNIYSYNLDNKKETSLTQKAKNIISIAYLSSANSIIYSGGDGNFSSLYLLPLKNYSEKNIGGEDIVDISASSDGGKIIYSQGSQNADVLIKNLTTDEAEKVILNSTQSEWYSKISPDGKRILFLSTLSGKTELWRSNINGDSLIQLTHNTEGKINYPSWSPDGKLITFCIFKNNKNQIYCISSGGGIPGLLFSDTFNNILPVWAVDGRSIYFRSSRENSDEIWNYNIADKSYTQITFDKGIYGQENSDGYFYYTRENMPYIWKKKISDNKSEKFFERVHREDFNNWKIVGGNIYFIDRLGPTATIYKYNSANEKETGLYTYYEKIKSYNMLFDISTDEKLLCFTSLEKLEVDLMMIEKQK